jgi:hypothetical protein
MSWFDYVAALAPGVAGQSAVPRQVYDLARKKMQGPQGAPEADLTGYDPLANTGALGMESPASLGDLPTMPSRPSLPISGEMRPPPDDSLAIPARQPTQAVLPPAVNSPTPAPIAQSKLKMLLQQYLNKGGGGGGEME